MSTVMNKELPRRPITVEEYRRMWEEGLIAPDARVELIEGEIVEMPPIGPPHSAIVSRLTQWLVFAAGDRAILRPGCPVWVNKFSLPQPDIALVKPRDDWYRTIDPNVETTLLVIEVSATSLSKDLTRKLRMYARKGVLEVWIVDVNGSKLHQFRGPDGETYQETVVIDKPGITPLVPLPGISVDLSRLFG